MHSEPLKVTVLGCGSSPGVPIPGCSCAVCTSNDPRNRRRRPSILIARGDAVVLVDTPADCREQLLDAGVKHLDGVIYTHMHADHVHGIDDLRGLNYVMGRDIDVYGDAANLAEIRSRFAYCFADTTDKLRYRPRLTPHEVEDRFAIAGLLFTAFPQPHGPHTLPTMGLRVGDFAYSTDVNELTDEAERVLAGIHTWVVDCLSDYPNFAHAHLDLTLEWIDRVRPARVVLTHMNHTVDYAEWAAMLPAGVEPGYDGLVLEVPWQQAGARAI